MDSEMGSAYFGGSSLRAEKMGPTLERVQSPAKISSYMTVKNAMV